jgi:hypothetical protein
VVLIDQDLLHKSNKAFSAEPTIIVEVIVVVTNGDFATGTRDNLTAPMVAGELDEFDARAFGEREG